jgi:hypothetical protein
MKTKMNFLKLIVVAGSLAICSGAFANSGTPVTKTSSTASHVSPEVLMLRDRKPLTGNSTMLLHIVRPPNAHKRVLSFAERTRFV